MNTKTKQNTLRLATLGMLAALAVLLVALIHFPLIPAAPFLEYDPADVPILIGTFLYGPWAGLGLAESVLVRTAVMCGCNLVFTPLFLGSSMGEVVMLLVPAIIPFNLLYAALNGAVTLVLYKPLSRFLHGVQKRA